MWENYTSESKPNSKIHPFETFCLFMDDSEYSDFEFTFIHPSIQAARYCNALFANSFLTELPITFAPGHCGCATFGISPLGLCSHIHR
jgi:hypothetical protein